MTLSCSTRRAALAASIAAVAALMPSRPASAQLGAAGPFGAYMNYGYYGGPGPYGWGPYAFGWGGYTVVGAGPVMPPTGGGFGFGTVPGLAAQMAPPPPTAADMFRQQALAASWRDRRREALRMEAKFDVSTGRPRDVPAQAPAPPAPLDQRLGSLFGPDGSIAWPSGMTATPAARQAAEQAARVALDQYRTQGRANVADVAYARQALSDYAAPLLAQLAATDDALSYQTAVDFFQRLDATLIDLADPPADPPAAPEAAPAPPG